MKSPCNFLKVYFQPIYSLFPHPSQQAGLREIKHLN